MKHSLVVTRLMDSLQGHRFVEDVFFGEVEEWSFAVLSTWRFMLRRRMLVVVERSGGIGGIADFGPIQQRIRQRARKEAGIAGFWRPQSWQWLIVAPENLAAVADEGVGSLHEPLIIYNPDGCVLQILRSGGEDEARVRDILERK